MDPSSKIIDFEMLNQRMRGDMSKCRSLFELFKSTAAPLVEQLKDAAFKCDRTQVAKHAHSILGMIVVFSGDRLKLTLLEIEALALSCDSDSGFEQQLVDCSKKVSVDYSEFCKALEQHLCASSL